MDRLQAITQRNYLHNIWPASSLRGARRETDDGKAGRNNCRIQSKKKTRVASSEDTLQAFLNSGALPTEVLQMGQVWECGRTNFHCQKIKK